MGCGRSKNAKQQKEPLDELPKRASPPHLDLKVEEADDPSPFPDTSHTPSATAVLAGARQADVDEPPSIITQTASQNTVLPGEMSSPTVSRTPQAADRPDSPDYPLIGGSRPGSPASILKSGSRPGTAASQGQGSSRPGSRTRIRPNPLEITETSVTRVEPDEAVVSPSVIGSAVVSPSIIGSDTSTLLQDHEKPADRNLCQVYRLCREYELLGHGQHRPDHHIRGVDFLESQNQIESTGAPDKKSPTSLWSKAKAGVGLRSWQGLARTARIVKRMSDSTFFQDLEQKTPGLIAKVAEVADIVTEESGQVLYRQGDRAANCFLVLNGEVGVYTVTKDRLKSIEKNSPRPSKMEAMQLKTLSEATHEQKIAYRKFQGDKKSDKEPDSPLSPKFRKKGRAQKEEADNSRKEKMDRFKTTEGFNSFSATSYIGKQLRAITSGEVFGESVLERDRRREETIKCNTDCELIAIEKEEYRAKLRSSIAKVKFFRNNIPGCGHDHGFDSHPAVFFDEASFCEGHNVITEGIRAEPRIFVISEGTVEFRRYMDSSDPRDNPYRQYQETTLSSSKGFSKSARPSLTWDLLSEGKMFCTLAAFPIQAYEPFSVVATSECKVFYAGATQMAKMPEKFLRGVRHYTMQDLLQRLLRMHPYVPDVFSPPPPAPPLSIRQNTSWVEPGSTRPTPKSARSISAKSTVSSVNSRATSGKLR